MDPFVSKHADDVIGTLSGFHRLVFRGTLRLLVQGRVGSGLPCHCGSHRSSIRLRSGI